MIEPYSFDYIVNSSHNKVLYFSAYCKHIVVDHFTAMVEARLEVTLF